MKIIDARHPNWLASVADWEKWRLTFAGGDEFRSRYLKKFSVREDDQEFQLRKDVSPVPAFAKAAVVDIRNSIHQRMQDVVRRGGSEGYQRAIAGLDGGVDRRGSTMNSFLGVRVLTNLLVMGKAGVFVDNSAVVGPTLATARQVQPYVYAYPVEDILSFTCALPEAPSEFQSVLLRDMAMGYDAQTRLPTVAVERYRWLWVDEETGQVNLQFYDADGNPSGPSGSLELTRIPFVLLDIGDSLLKDVAQHQIALLNLVSSDVSFALKANFPFLTRQSDLRAAGSHLKQAATADGTATSGGQGAADVNVRVGVTQGLTYDVETERPGFVHPSPDPLRASMELQSKLEADIRKLINLAVLSLATRGSAESKSLDNQGLEAGLSYLGLVLESAERKIGELWAAYEERNPAKRLIPTIKYPDRYSLKTDADRIEESTKLSKLMYSVPGRTVKREIAKCIVQSLLGGKVSVDTVEAINQEIDKAKYTTSDPETLIRAKEAGLVGEQTASSAMGFDDDEYLQAREDHLSRVIRLQQAQTSANETFDPAARGAADLSANPQAGRDEKTLSRMTDTTDDVKVPVRGEGKAVE